jgi:hypothetical protein
MTKAGVEMVTEVSKDREKNGTARNPAYHAWVSFPGPANKRTINRSPSSISSGMVPLCSSIFLMIFRGTPMPICSR